MRGNVLAAGRFGIQTGNLASAEVYNPTTATWTTTAPLATARYLFQMVLLPNGNILAAGGTTNAGIYLASAEVYNPTTATWTTTAPLATARSFFLDGAPPQRQRSGGWRF